MVRKLARLFLLLLLIVSLPARSMAGATMLFCEITESSSAASSSTAEAHAGLMAIGVDEMQTSDHHDESDSGHSHSDQSICSACCAACTSVALQAAEFHAPVAILFPSLVPFQGHAFAGFIGDPALRPPSLSVV